MSPRSNAPLVPVPSSAASVSGGGVGAMQQLIDACERQSILSRLLWPLAPTVDVTPWARAWWAAATHVQSEFERACALHAQPLSDGTSRHDRPARQNDREPRRG